MLTFPPIAFTPPMHAACEPSERCTVLYRVEGRKHLAWSQRVERFERSCILHGVEQEIARVEANPGIDVDLGPLMNAKRKADRSLELAKARAMVADLVEQGAVSGFDEDVQASELRVLLSDVVVGVRQNGAIVSWPKGFEAQDAIIDSAPRMFWLQVLAGVRQQQYDRAELGKS